MTMFISVGTLRLYNTDHFRNFQVLAESEFAAYACKLIGYTGPGEYDYNTLFMGTEAECQQMLYDITRSLSNGDYVFAIEGNGTQEPVKEDQPVTRNVNQDYDRIPF